MTIETLMWLSGPTTAVAWWAFTRLNDKHTRELIREEFGRMIDVKLANFKKELNSETGYRRTESCGLMMGALGQRVDAAAESIQDLQRHQMQARRAVAGEGVS